MSTPDTNCEKVTYPSRDIAARMTALLRMHLGGKKQLPYRCLNCHQWHTKTRKNHVSSGQRRRRKGSR